MNQESQQNQNNYDDLFPKRDIAPFIPLEDTEQYFFFEIS